MAAPSRLRRLKLLVVALLAGSLALGGAVPAVASEAAPSARTAAGDIRKAADLSLFNPGNIMSDAVFFHPGTMSGWAIQQFLDQRLPSCDPGATCLNGYRQDTATRPADAYCAGYEGRASESAAEIIHKVALSCGVNPQVLLVTLQKEQGLVTARAPGASRYRIAMGFACPDTAACDTRYYGFQNQVYSAARQFQLYRASSYFTWYAPGKTWNILFHPNSSCGRSPVYVENDATAGLYYYTPYQPNAAALRAGYGTGDSCSSYGNRNFYQYFTDWFGSTQYIATDTRFVDVSTQASSPAYSVFANEISWLAGEGISAGWEVGRGYWEYRPTVAVSRDVMAAFLYRLAGSPAYTPPATSPYSDVPVNYPFFKEIAWLSSSGIADGWESGDGMEFRPAAAVTRDVMAAFLHRFAGEPVFDAPATSSFADVASSHPFYAEISWLASTGISQGWARGDGRSDFRPQAEVTRDVMAAFLQRLDGYFSRFADVGYRASSPFYSVFAGDIAWLAATGVSEGWDVGGGVRHYRPGTAVSRDVMAAFLYRMAGEPAFTAPATSPFVDVSTAYPFYKEITWLAASGISEGWETSAGREYRPKTDVTRDVMAAFLRRFSNEPPPAPPTVSPFLDVTTGHPFAGDIAWLADAEVSEGWAVPGGKEFRPFAPVTRDVMAAFLHRIEARNAGGAAR